MQFAFALGSLAFEYSLRYLLLLYVVPLVLLMMGSRAATDGVRMMLRPAKSFGSADAKMREVDANMRKGGTLLALAAFGFSLVFYRADIFQCLASLF
ncbi:hypothetical protein [Cupriavidus pauculus]|uniref:hypothetical protein n=1 Tax=Cupriavidus pauculus TaxID=82633 RepID=UPI00385768CE